MQPIIYQIWNSSKENPNGRDNVIQTIREMIFKCHTQYNKFTSERITQQNKKMDEDTNDSKIPHSS